MEDISCCNTSYLITKIMLEEKKKEKEERLGLFQAEPVSSKYTFFVGQLQPDCRPSFEVGVVIDG